jgi:hypothetical protein
LNRFDSLFVTIQYVALYISTWFIIHQRSLLFILSYLSISAKLNRCWGQLKYGLEYVNFLEKLVSSVSPTWAYGKRWPWTLLAISRAHHALPFYALWVGHPEKALLLFQRWSACRAGGLQLFSTPLDAPCHTSMIAKEYYALNPAGIIPVRQSSLSRQTNMARGIQGGSKTPAGCPPFGWSLLKRL